MSGSRYPTRSQAKIDDKILGIYPNERRNRRNRSSRLASNKSSSEENLETFGVRTTTPVDPINRSNSYPQLPGTPESKISINELTLRLEDERQEIEIREEHETDNEVQDSVTDSDTDTDFYGLPSKSTSKFETIEATKSSEDPESPQISVINRHFSLRRSLSLTSQNLSQQKNHSTPINKEKSTPKGFLSRVRQTLTPFISTLTRNKEIDKQIKSPSVNTSRREFSSNASSSFLSFRKSQRSNRKTLMDGVTPPNPTDLDKDQQIPNPIETHVQINITDDKSEGSDIAKPFDKIKNQKDKQNTEQNKNNSKASAKTGNKNQPEMVPPNQLVSLRDALAVVPEYDGESTSLTAFIQGCEEAKAMLEPNSERYLVKAIRAKIKGEPKRTISLMHFDTVYELYDYLKDIYAPAKNMYQLQGELGTSYQKKDESVIGFANRLRDIGHQIVEAHEYERETLAEEAFLEDTEKSVVSCFLQGLKPEIEQRLANVPELNMNEMVKRAVKIEKQLSARGALRSERGESSSARGNKNENKRQVNLVTAEEPMCQICKRTGHRADTCTYNKQHNSQAPPLPAKKADEKNIPTCQSCNKIGHTADKCFKLFPPNNNKPPDGTTIVICQACNKRGHTADRCFQLFPPEIKEQKIITCQICKNPGHMALNCPRLIKNSSISQQGQVPNSLRYQNPPIIKCQICKKDGHTAHICPYRNAQSQPLNQNSNRDQRSYAEVAGESFDMNRACHYCKQPGHFIRDCQARINNELRGASTPGNARGLPGMGATGGPALEGHPMRGVSAASRAGDQEL